MDGELGKAARERVSDDPVQVLMEQLLGGWKPSVSDMFRDDLSQAVIWHSQGRFGDPLEVPGMVRFVVEVCALVDEEVARHRASWSRAYKHLRDGKPWPFGPPLEWIL